MSGIPRVLSIAGSDPSGGAGVQGDLKSIAANGGYAMAAISALTAQNTTGVRAIHVPPPEFLSAQLEAISDDITVDAVKIGMLGTAAVARVVGEWLVRHRPPVVVLDPVMVATSGDRLVDADAEDAVSELITRSDLVTPNIPELAVLTDAAPARTLAEALEQAHGLADRSGVRVLVKGGHLRGLVVTDALLDRGVVTEFTGDRVPGSNTHGTGCALSSALATRVAAHGDWALATQQAKDWLTAAISAGRQLAVGHGNGPVDHLVGLRDEPARPAGPREATVRPR
ncbi:bifunctional hydroxymethylpyrimidine kinase/phosphomethylpyrimidine kinase [Naumannella halotolerans]|uniref:Hydroxymethylpyrimidine/phosphomethylpyrimidine kinase n=1 Tax=Naumannella halotolerans TaxID=993414 RepID=A0A4V3ENG0_9ACTN|nr:bifunctional hydroxymethylpyrimidine kinase/phosphomethylpyrimidine kinase [Naumannella halotolerans]TDT33618.1 hydroxymethylpyrimidine/phosphomethylpyrimidine kinase [Naumannella halotolerans]